MSIWNDLFEIYQSVQQDERVASSDKADSKSQIVPTPQTPTDEDSPTQTVYVFAYIDDGKGNISRNIAVEDRITMLEMKNQELEYRYNRLLEKLDDQEEDQDDE